MSKGKTIVLGLFTLWPFVYVIVFMLMMFLMFLADVSGALPAEPEIMFVLFFALHFLTMIEIVILLVIYVVYLFRTERVPQDKKALWAVVLLLGTILAMPVFWYLYIWRDIEPPIRSGTG